MKQDSKPRTEKSADALTLESVALQLAAIGHRVRLKIYKDLVQAGPNGLAAGEIARRLDMAPSSLNFHLRALQHSQLVNSRIEGRFVIYAAQFESMTGLLEFLTENCCGGNPCLPVTPTKLSSCRSKPITQTS